MIKKLIVWAGAAFAILAFASAAHANDSDYYLTFNNKTGQVLTVQMAYVNCVTFSPDTGTLPVTLQDKTSIKLHFYRSSSCHGKNGQVVYTAAETWPGIAPKTYPITVSTDFSADGAFALNTQGTPRDAATRWDYSPYITPNSSAGVLTFVNQDHIDLATALKGQCWAPADNIKAVQGLNSYSDIGSVTATAISGFSSNAYTSQRRVTTEVWGFRAPTFSRGESGAMKKGFLLSKAMDKLSGSDAAGRAGFWLSHGPQNLEGDTSQLLGLRLLATSSSNEPRSQTVSVALNYETASIFRQTWDDYVYAFHFIPGSEVLGLKECAADKPAGELQFQPIGGVAIYDLMRSADGVTWAAWTGADWAPSGVTPSNPPTPLLREAAPEGRQGLAPKKRRR